MCVVVLSGDPNIILQGNIKSISNEGFQSSRTNMISYSKHNFKVKVQGNEVKRSENTFVVRILGFDIPIPLCILCIYYYKMIYVRWIYL